MKDKYAIYRGFKGDDGPTVVRYPHREQLHPDRSQLIVTHSEEFEWGYNGSGPAQLALAILLDYFNSEKVARAYYQQFKAEIIANLDDEGGQWTLTGEEIAETIDEFRKQDAVEASNVSTKSPV